MFVYVFLEFVGDQCDVWVGGLKACVMLRGLLLGKALRAGEGRSGEPVMQGSVSPLIGAPQSVERRLWRLVLCVARSFRMTLSAALCLFV